MRGRNFMWGHSPGSVLVLELSAGLSPKLGCGSLLRTPEKLMHSATGCLCSRALSLTRSLSHLIVYLPFHFW